MSFPVKGKRYENPMYPKLVNSWLLAPGALRLL